jgi:hypothetical protein
MSLWDKVQASVKKTSEKAGVAAHKAKLRTDMYVHCSGGNRDTQGPLGPSHHGVSKTT